MKKLIHCSFDLVYDFTPRVPESRTKLEESKTPRICVAPTILCCLKSMPRAGEIIRWMRAVGMKPVVHAYYLKSDNVYTPNMDEVIDVLCTHEMWVLDKPSDWHRRDYEIVSCCMEDKKDIFGNNFVKIHSVEIKPVKYTDNLMDLITGLGHEHGDFMRRFPFLNFRDFATNIMCTEELKEMRKKNLLHKNFDALQARVELYRKRVENANG